MQEFLHHYARVMTVISRFAMIFCASCLALLVALTGWMVFGRYILNDPPTWAENSILVLILFVSAMGAGIGIRERMHLQVLFVLDHVAPRTRLVMEVSANLVMLAFGIVMIHGGWVATAQVWPFADAMLPISRGTYYIPMVLTGILITLFEIEILLEMLTGSAPHVKSEGA